MLLLSFGFNEVETLIFNFLIPILLLKEERNDNFKSMALVLMRRTRYVFFKHRWVDDKLFEVSVGNAKDEDEKPSKNLLCKSRWD